MRTFRLMTVTAVATSALAWAGCVNSTLWGFQLGPQGQQGLAVQGVLFYQPATCTFTCNGQYRLGGSLEVGKTNTVPDTYEAILEVKSDLNNNAPLQTAGPHGTTYGTRGSANVEIVGASVRYEYPTLSSARFTYQQFPNDGTFLQAQTMASGNLAAPAGSAATCMPIQATLIDKKLARLLADDPDVKERLKSDGQVPIIAKFRLEGRSGSGARITSNEVSYRIDIVPPGKLYFQAAPTPEKCTGAVSTGGTAACPTGQRVVRESPCFPGQDWPETCSCQ